jgi:hypothetical protein
MIEVGFVLLTHSEPDQVLRLARVLTELYDAPPIACHHDFSQCPLDKDRFPQNVHFVEPHYPTFWGCFSIIPAAIAGMRSLLEKRNPPDWLYLLSGSDYPAASPDAVRSMLGETRFDAFIDHREIGCAGPIAVENESELTGFSRSSYRSIAYRRYCAVAVPRPSLKKPLAFPPVGRTYLNHPMWRSMLGGPFSNEFRCFAGEHWFTANAQAAAILVQETEVSKRLWAHLQTRESPEECYYHSILGNAPLRLSGDNLRYIDWPSVDAWHPRTLTLADLLAIVRSGAHFARKTAHGSELTNALDRICGVGLRNAEPVRADCVD